MDESAARKLMAVRAIELEDRERALWSDADRAWASEVAARDVGERAGPDAFLAARAARAVERLAVTAPALRRTLAAFTWRGWIAPVLLAIAFAAGVMAERIDGAARINILAPPVLGVLAWNLAVYALLLLRPVVRRGTARFTGPVRDVVLALGAGRITWRPAPKKGPLAGALTAFATQWTRMAAPIYVARAARLLHAGAALFAAGVIAGLYLRGIAFEYRATWESTFLDPAQVHRMLAFVLAPGAWLTGLGVPTAEHIASIRSPGSNGENAARWLHLFAATLGIVVIVPRLALAAWDGWLEERRAKRMRIDLDEPYFRKLLRGFRDTPIAIAVVPYSYTLPPERAAALEALIARTLGARVDLALRPVVPYGGEDALAADAIRGGSDVVVALFNAAATPEREAHGAFAAGLAGATAQRRAATVALVDESLLRERWGPDPAQREGRRAAWRDVLSASGADVVFVDLGAPDPEAVESALMRALDATPATRR